MVCDEIPLARERAMVYKTFHVDVGVEMFQISNESSVSPTTYSHVKRVLLSWYILTFINPSPPVIPGEQATGVVAGSISLGGADQGSRNNFSNDHPKINPWRLALGQG